MKSLIEGWRNYTKLIREQDKEEELSNLEKLHFGGDLKDIGESLKFLVDQNTHDGDTDYYQIMQILKDSDETKIKYQGQGSFRITFSYGNDIVFKVAKTQTAKEMNQQDTMLGRMPKYSSLFPKVFSKDKNYDWIVMEKCVPITDSEKMLSFFPSKIFDQISKREMLDYTKIRVFMLLLAYNVAKFANNTDEMEDNQNILQSTYRISEDEINSIIKSFGTTFSLLCQMINEFDISVQEMRPYNVGISPDNRFVVIDSSIGSAISKGIRSLNENKNKIKRS